jgi:hypothetical protein
VSSSNPSNGAASRAPFGDERGGSTESSGPSSGPTGVRASKQESAIVPTMTTTALDDGWDDAPVPTHEPPAHDTESSRHERPTAPPALAPSEPAVGDAVVVTATADDGSIDVEIDVDEDAEADVTCRVPTREILHRKMYERFLDSDYPEALTLAESLLQLTPNDSTALVVLERCRAALQGSMVPVSQVPELAPSARLRVTIAPANLKMLPLDPKTMFVLSLLDGSTDLETAFTMAGVKEQDVIDKLADLVRRGILTSAQ